MKTIFLITLLILSSCASKKETSEVLPPVEVIKPSTQVSTDATVAPAYLDTDCGKMVPENFSIKVMAAIYNKPHLLAHKSSVYYWQAFFKSLAKAESCLNITERYVEKGLGKDAVTGLQNTSEGLFQLSYQDAKYHGCNFTWLTDKKLAVKDVQKTIFNVDNQVNCAAIILDKQLKNGKPIYSRYYWAVLDPKDARHKVFLRYMKSEGF